MRGISILCAKPLSDVNNNFVNFSKLHVLDSGGGKQGKSLHTQQLMPKVVALHFIHLPSIWLIQVISLK